MRPPILARSCLYKYTRSIPHLYPSRSSAIRIGPFRSLTTSPIALNKASTQVEGATDISHSSFLSSASPESDFNPLQTPHAGQDPNPTIQNQDTSTHHGRLSPTNSHLFKLILPLPNQSWSNPLQPTAFLLHPSQPLSHLSRLILGSLPPEERGCDIQYRALTGNVGDLDDHLRNAEGEEADSDGDAGSRSDISGDGKGKGEGDEGGPRLTERRKDQGRWQEVSWSESTDLSDFIKSCLNERFKIVITPARRTDVDQGVAREKEERKEMVLTVVIPSFASRTTYLRKRLLTLTKELDRMTKQKKRVDLMAHKGARRLAVAALSVGVGYWVAVIRWTFFTDAGWDLMEPVTWSVGFGSLLASVAFLAYHNREVSYSSLLDLSITARRRRLYDQHGLDIDEWTELVAEAKTIRREITRIAKDYDLEWKGELENLDPASSQSQDPSKPGSSSSSSSATSSSSSSSIGPHPKDENGEKLDIDKTIDEASELAEQSQVRSKKEKAAQRKGEGGDREGEKGRRRREDEGVKRGKELVGK